MSKTASGGPGWFYLLVLSMLCAFGPMCTDIYLPGLPQVTADFGVDASTAQLTLTSSFLGLSLGQIFVGPISDALGRRMPLLLSLLVFMVASCMCAWSNDILMMIIWRFFQGAAGSGGLVLARSLACDLFKGPALTRFMSLLMAVNSVAPIAGPVLGSVIINFSSWEMTFWVLGLWGVLLLVLCGARLPESLPPEQREQKIWKSFVSMCQELLNLRFLCYVLSFSFVMGGFFAYIAASPFVFQVIYTFTPLEFSLLFALVAVGVSLASLAAGRLGGRLGEVKVVRGAYVLMIFAAAEVLCCALTDPQSYLPLAAGLAFFCAMMGVALTAGFAVVMGARKGGAGGASGLLGVVNYIFGAAAAPLMGLMGDASMLPLGLCLLVCAVMALVLFEAGGWRARKARQKRQRQKKRDTHSAPRV